MPRVDTGVIWGCGEQGMYRSGASKAPSVGWIEAHAVQRVRDRHFRGKPWEMATTLFLCYVLPMIIHEQCYMHPVHHRLGGSSKRYLRMESTL
jgi:hypothetical protein